MNICQDKVKNCRISGRFFDDLFQMALSIYDNRTKALLAGLKSPAAMIDVFELSDLSIS